MAINLTSIHGRRLGLSPQDSLVSNGVEVTDPCTDASITVGAEQTNVRAITIQLKDSKGKDITRRTLVQIVMLADANGDAFVATGGSTGIAIGTDGALSTIVAKKMFWAISEADGDIDLTYTDTGTEAVYLALVLPNGRMVISSALTNT